MNISDFADKGPEMLPEKFLVGELDGWGVIETPLGNLQSRFTVKATGKATADGVDFNETWTVDNDLVDTLRWRIRRADLGAYAGTEDRVEGEAKGEQAGCAFHWTYTRDTPQPDGSSTKLNFDDWFYMIDERTCIVRGSAGRLGLPFAIVHVTYRKAV